jgi:hypothetical protein
MNCPVQITISRQQRQGDQRVLRHTYLNKHNHGLTSNPFRLKLHASRRPGFAEAILIAKTHRGILTFSESKEVLNVKSNHVTSTRVHDHVQGPLVFLNMYI